MSAHRQRPRRPRPRAGPEFTDLDGSLRGREAQHREAVEQDVEAHSAMPQPPFHHLHPEMQEEAEKVNAPWLDEAHDDLQDAEEKAGAQPASPRAAQIRRARSTTEKGKMPKSKNTGIKGRDASGKKHARK